MVGGPVRAGVGMEAAGGPKEPGYEGGSKADGRSFRMRGMLLVVGERETVSPSRRVGVRSLLNGRFGVRIGQAGRE